MPPVESAPIRVLIAERHALVREATRRILQHSTDIIVVGEADNGVDAVEQAKLLKPDVALLDMRMPGLNGIEATRQIKSHMSGTAVLILTVSDGDDYVQAMLDAGASGYLLETVAAAKLADAVRRVSAGETVIDPATARRLAHLPGPP